MDLDFSKVPEFDELTVVFGAPREAYLDRQSGSEAKRRFRKQAEVAQSLFFKGGKLTQYGLKLKPEIDSGKAQRAIRALLCSFEPPHEAKIGTVASYLNEWCDECAPETPASDPKPESKKAVARASRKWRKKR